MASKSKKRQKQDASNIKITNDIISGRTSVGMPKRPKQSQANRIGGGAAADEQGYLTSCYIRLLRILLPGILAELSLLEDPRDQSKIKHSLPALILYGILIFLNHIESRRAANREIGGSELSGLMHEFVPDFKSMPHADTTARLLEGMDTNELETKYEGMVGVFIKSPQFKELNPGLIQVVVDATEKFMRDWCWDIRAQSRNAGDPGKERYFAYMLESVLILGNGIVLPLLTEPLENGEHLDGGGKQDCEQNAFKRIVVRLKRLFGNNPLMITADGLYATGPVISLCNNYNWEYMITLKEDCLASVWEDFNGLRKLEKENVKYSDIDGRRQEYHWSNELEYIYGKNNKLLSLNVVTCKETWFEESKRKGKPCEKTTKYAWLSSSKLNAENVVNLCKKARKRWCIENHFLTVKKQGYKYEHCFSYNWNAMKGFHCLAKIAFFINTVILQNQAMQKFVAAEGKRGIIKKVWGYLRYNKLSDFCPLLNPDSICRVWKKVNFRKLELKMV